jgi:hypothetical protein
MDQDQYPRDLDQQESHGPEARRRVGVLSLQRHEQRHQSTGMQHHRDGDENEGGEERRHGLRLEVPGRF